MRQKDDPLLISVLKRLRKGVCTAEDKERLDKWISKPDTACPLIVCTNAARDHHNEKMAETFATATGQGCHIYHGKDTRGRGRKRHQLTGLAAEVAWAVPVKEANDLGGKVPYLPGMPVFCTENIATELGISNSSPGALISTVYEETEGRRYAISAEGRSMDVCCIDLANYPTIQSAYVMLSWNHISEELRNELKRTDLKAEITKAYSRERLSWFYSLVPDGQIRLLTQEDVKLEEFDFNMAMMTD
ncbi:ATP-dependent DNA helicase [Mycena venus]|uniref:ATP-dependent DNA helicase n=1 Tax=Mycena venus TaxID=2733690 RepID=A0A8H6XPE7_9AGAR|nr:ATP-dependent DNA helicase [Mycena venus]